MLGLLCAQAVPVRAQETGCVVESGEVGDPLADAMAEAQCQGGAARKKILRLEREAIELRRASEAQMERNGREAEKLKEAIDLAKRSEIHGPVTVRALPPDGRWEALLIAKIARAACAKDPRDYSSELNALNWEAFRKVRNLESYMTDMSLCEMREFLNIVEQSRVVRSTRAAISPSRRAGA